MDAVEKVIFALQKQLKTEVAINLSDHLRDDLQMDSMSLVEFTVLVHSEFNIDLGRKAVEMKLIPETVADIVSLVDAS